MTAKEYEYEQDKERFFDDIHKFVKKWIMPKRNHTVHSVWVDRDNMRYQVLIRIEVKEGTEDASGNE